ncbi:uncharacterized protein [Musca autumnalis]|uniref:uncharacterized protein n=1 Tax=Musca autumnalis TaxID=221902 RepID=UPI003CF7843C
MSKHEIQIAIRNKDPRIRLVTNYDGRSDVWKNYQRIEYDNVLVDFACCIKCKSVLTYQSKQGTGSLARHTCFVNQGRLHDTNSSNCSNETLDEIQKTYHDVANNEVIMRYTNEPPKKFQKINEEKDDAQNIAKSILHEDVDSSDLMGLAWAKKLRKMKPLQSKLAERLIAEIIFQGEMDMLTANTVIQSKKLKLSTTGRSTSREESPDKHIATTVIKTEPASEEITVEEYSVTSYNNENNMWGQ